MGKRIAIKLIEFYQRRISVLYPPCCRFTPTCSSYTKQAIEIHGLFYGTFLGIKRILRCHPFYKGNLYDPVPEKVGKVDENRR